MRRKPTRSQLSLATLVILAALAIIVPIAYQRAFATQTFEDYFCTPGNGCALCGSNETYSCTNIILPGDYSWGDCSLYGYVGLLCFQTNESCGNQEYSCVTGDPQVGMGCNGAPPICHN